METPDFQLNSVCSLDSIQACSIPVSRNSLTALLYDFYLALIGLVAYFVLRPPGDRPADLLRPGRPGCPGFADLASDPPA